ncbi:MAG: hypothetical protein JW990_07930 [Thermoleophilia bacterium]|nr:hypothetical protein [Thermoleophilia bacterium]
MTPHATVLAHGDLDGMVSAILLLGRLQPDTRVIITNGARLHRELAGLADSQEPVSDIYVVDVPLALQEAASVAAAMRRVGERGAKVHVYDHHLGWEQAESSTGLREACAMFIVDTRKTTAAVLVHRHFLGGAPEGTSWLRLLSEKGDSADPGIRQRFGILAALMDRRHWKLTEPTLKALACGAPHAKEQERLADWYYNEHLPRERKLAEEAEILTTRQDRRLAWFDLRQEQGHYHLAKLAAEIHRVQLTATVDRKGVLLGGESIDKGVDLQPLHGRHEHQGVAFSVAGHKSPVRFAPLDGKVSDELVAAVRAFILERV